MAKTLVEMTTEIVAAQAASGRISPEELSDSIYKVYQALGAVQKQEQLSGDAAQEGGAHGPRAPPDRAQARNQARPAK